MTKLPYNIIEDFKYRVTDAGPISDADLHILKMIEAANEAALKESKNK